MFDGFLFLAIAFITQVSEDTSTEEVNTKHERSTLSTILEELKQEINCLLFLYLHIKLIPLTKKKKKKHSIRKLNGVPSKILTYLLILIDNELLQLVFFVFSR